MTYRNINIFSVEYEVFLWGLELFIQPCPKLVAKWLSLQFAKAMQSWHECREQMKRLGDGHLKVSYECIFHSAKHQASLTRGL